MSVDRTALIGLGWMLTPEKFNEMYEYVGDEKWPEVADEFMWINAYDCDSPKFLGCTYGEVADGDYADLIALMAAIDAEFNSESFSEHYTKILEFCGQEIGPETEWAEAHIYIINWLH